MGFNSLLFMYHSSSAKAKHFCCKFEFSLFFKQNWIHLSAHGSSDCKHKCWKGRSFQKSYFDFERRVRWRDGGVWRVGGGKGIRENNLQLLGGFIRQLLCSTDNSWKYFFYADSIHSIYNSGPYPAIPPRKRNVKTFVIFTYNVGHSRVKLTMWNILESYLQCGTF